VVDKQISRAGLPAGMVLLISCWCPPKSQSIFQLLWHLM